MRRKTELQKIRSRWNELKRFHNLSLRKTQNCGVNFLSGTYWIAQEPRLLEIACQDSPAAVILSLNSYDLLYEEQRELFDALREMPGVGYTKCPRNANNTLHIFTIPTQVTP